ncbi:hypothetical protein B0H13DRAFT_1882118 [Mycena leptocephala]|nr:hypothetical protein B0H13DRAFT_1882118 [Mycena leptocephala]
MPRKDPGDQFGEGSKPSHFPFVSRLQGSLDLQALFAAGWPSVSSSIASMALAKRTDFTCPNTDLAGNPLLAATLTSNDGGVTVPGLPDVPGLGICQYGSGFCDYDPECQCLSFFQRYPIINVAIFGWTIQRAHPNLEPFRYRPLDSLHTGCTTIFPAISPPRVVAPGKASFYLRTCG